MPLTQVKLIEEVFTPGSNKEATWARDILRLDQISEGKGLMKLFLFLLASSLVFSADWDAVQRIPAAQKIEVTVRNGGGRLRATLVSASPDTIVVREASGERSIPRADIRKLRVFDSGRRTHRGLLWTLIGAGAGAGASLAACASCANEGHNQAKYVPAGVAVGAAIGALGFLSSPYRTVYKSR